MQIVGEANRSSRPVVATQTLRDANCNPIAIDNEQGVWKRSVTQSRGAVLHPGMWWLYRDIGPEQTVVGPRPLPAQSGAVDDSLLLGTSRIPSEAPF